MLTSLDLETYVDHKYIHSGMIVLSCISQIDNQEHHPLDPLSL